MDNLTHGLFGLALSALRRRDGGERWSTTDKAVPLACVVASELPDLDSLWPSADPVLGMLQAHRGPTHAVVMAPVVALVATLVARACFRGAHPRPVFLYSLLTVPLAHLLPDAWTGWGTRVWWPFSSERLALDWTLVVDPLVTAPLLLAALVGLWRRNLLRPALLCALALSGSYVAARAALRGHLARRIAQSAPAQARVAVFPAWGSPLTWRYVVEDGREYRVGELTLGGAPRERARLARPAEAGGDLPPEVREAPTVREALAWARFPLLQHARTLDGGHALSIADLRYHLGGSATLRFRVELAPDGAIRAARLDRGGTASELLQRWQENERSP